MWGIGCMVWRIGETLDVYAQMEWIREAGFKCVSFHASSGDGQTWRGIDPKSADRAQRRRLRQLLRAFSACEVHAPFDCALTPDAPEPRVQELCSVLEFAGDVSASVVTVHADVPQSLAGGEARWQAMLDRLDAAAGAAGVVIGFEVTDGFEHFTDPARRHTGITLDVGHMDLEADGGSRRWGSIGAAVHHLGPGLVHLHVHDVCDGRDHAEVGTGRVDFDDLLCSLRDARYQGALCLELDPDRVSPHGIRRSADFLRARGKQLGL